MKKTMIICAPFSTRSGYGDHARDLFHSFYDLDRFDIKVIDVRWGDTPRNALKDDNPKDKLIMDRIIKNPNGGIDQPDIYVDIRIPNEFQTVGKFNIGITAGIETNAVSQKWLEGCNRMDLVIVPSEHSKSGFKNSMYEQIGKDHEGKPQKIGEFICTSPVEVLFEGVDLDVFKPYKETQLDDELESTLDNIEEDFAFLFVGQWVKGGYGEDRKDIAKLIKLFYETFVNSSKKPALILKTSGANFSILDKEDVFSKCRSIKSHFPDMMQDKLPNVYILHGDLSPNQINSLYNSNKVKAMITLTHGEGFGRPMLEASMAGLPVIAPNWSGQVDFLDENYSVLLGGELKEVPESAVWEDIIIKESKWFVVNESEVKNAFNFVYKNNYDVKLKAKKLMEINRENFSHNSMTQKLGEILDKYYKSEVKLNLPKLEMSEDENPSVDLSEMDNFFKRKGIVPNKYVPGLEEEVK